MSEIERCQVGTNAPKVAPPKQTGAQLELAIEPTALCRVFGVDDPGVASRLLGELANVLQPDPSKPMDAATINDALAMIQGIGPSGATEAMIAVMMAAAYHAAMDATRRAAHPAQTPAGRQSYSALGLKAMRTYAQLLEVLNHNRGHGPIQRIVIERVNFAPGAQGVVGAVGPRI